MKFYSRFNGAFFVMPRGKVLTFAGGMYETDDKEEIELLTSIAKRPQEEVVSMTPVALHTGDARIMREVGGGRQPQIGSGMVSSQTIAELAASSGS